MDYVWPQVEFNFHLLENLIHWRVEKIFLLRFSVRVNLQIYREKKIRISLVHFPVRLAVAAWNFLFSPPLAFPYRLIRLKWKANIFCPLSAFCLAFSIGVSVLVLYYIQRAKK